MLTKLLAFIQRDFINETSYKLAFATQFFDVLLLSLTFFFLSKLLENVALPQLNPYGGDYFSFVLFGLAMREYLRVALHTLASNIRRAQITGTLEALLVTQTEVSTIIFSSSLYSFIFTSLRVLVFLLLGMFVFGVNIYYANIPIALLIFLLTVICFISIGIIAASFIMVLKRGDPVTWIFTRASWLLGGVYFPISILPIWLQKISYLLPITHSLEGIRLTLLKGYTLERVATNIIALTIFSLILLPVSMLIFRYSVNMAKRDGSLTQY